MVSTTKGTTAQPDQLEQLRSDIHRRMSSCESGRILEWIEGKTYEDVLQDIPIYLRIKLIAAGFDEFLPGLNFKYVGSHSWQILLAAKPSLVEHLDTRKVDQSLLFWLLDNLPTMHDSLCLRNLTEINQVCVARKHPHLIPRLRYTKLTGQFLQHFLCLYPRYASECDLSTMSPGQWKTLLYHRPKLLKHCKPEYIGDVIKYFLSEHPEWTEEAERRGFLPAQ